VHDIHGIDFFQTTTLRLADEEVDNHGAGQIRRSEDVAISVVYRCCDEGGEEAGAQQMLVFEKECFLGKKCICERTYEIRKLKDQFPAVARPIAVAR